MNLYVLTIIVSIAAIIMFITIFVVVLKIWNLQKEILASGGYPTVQFARAKRDGKALTEGRVTWDYEKDEVIRILSQYPDDPEAAALVTRLKGMESSVGADMVNNHGSDGEIQA